MRRLVIPRLSRAVVLLGMAALLASPAAARADNDEEKRVTESMAVLETLVRAPDQGIPEHILTRAEAIVVIPSLVKGGFIVGAQHGRGIMSVRNRETNTWSAPGFVALTGGSIGWQIGVQATDLVLLVMNRDGVKDLLDTEFKVGANASVAAGPVGPHGRSLDRCVALGADSGLLAYPRVVRRPRARRRVASHRSRRQREVLRQGRLEGRDGARRLDHHARGKLVDCRAGAARAGGRTGSLNASVRAHVHSW